jgi:hypothetical protein
MRPRLRRVEKYADLSLCEGENLFAFFARFEIEKPSLAWCTAACLRSIPNHTQAVQASKCFINIRARSMSVENLHANFGFRQALGACRRPATILSAFRSKDPWNAAMTNTFLALPKKVSPKKLGGNSFTSFNFYPRRESNPHLRFRKPPFYPLNYGDASAGKKLEGRSAKSRDQIFDFSFADFDDSCRRIGHKILYSKGVPNRYF